MPRHSKDFAKSLVLAVFFLAVGALPATSQSPNPGTPVRPALPLGLDLYMPVPEDNPLTEEKIALGRRLFFDPILSRDYTLSCGSCHDPRRAFTDGLPVAVGIQGRHGTRNAPTLVNRAYGRSQFLDGRAASLEEQALQPIDNPDEFAMTMEEVLARLKAHSDYPSAFLAAFGTEPNPKDMARALAAYVRTILSGNAPIDRYMSGEREALSEEARQGLRLFRGKANCTACHLGPTFTDEQFHNTGVAWREGELLDVGRFKVTGKPEDRGKFKTPTLRNLTRTAPYMHDGSLKTLDEVIEFYDRGGNANPTLDPELRRLNLSEKERDSLLSFLKSLEGDIQEGSPRKASKRPNSGKNPASSVSFGSVEQWGRFPSIRREIGVPGAHHGLSHHRGDEKKIADIAQINRYHMEQFAYFIDRLGSTPDGEGSLLDHSVVVYGSGLADGNRHSHHDLPVLVAGRGCGKFHPGRHIRYPQGTPMTNLYLTILDRVGVPAETLGDSTGPLKDLAEI